MEKVDNAVNLIGCALNHTNPAFHPKSPRKTVNRLNDLPAILFHWLNDLPVIPFDWLNDLTVILFDWLNDLPVILFD